MIKRILFGLLFFTSTVFASDTISWVQTNPYPPVVTTNSGSVYVTTFVFQNKTGHTLVKPLQIGRLLSPAGEFTVTDACTGKYLVNNATCTVKLDLTPVTVGAKSLQLVIEGYSNKQVPVPSSPATTTATTTTTTSVTGAFTTNPWPTSLSAGQSQAYSFTFTNNSATTAATGVSVSCSSNISNCTVNNCSPSLAPSAPCTVTGNFIPTAAMAGGANQTISATLSYNQGSPVSVSAPPVQITSASNVVGAFSATNWPASIKESTALTLTPSAFIFTNNGGAAVSIVSITCSNNMACTNTCGSSLAVGHSCPVQGVFSSGVTPGEQTVSASFEYSQDSHDYTVTALSPATQVTDATTLFGIATPSAATVTQGVGTTITFTYTNYSSSNIVIPASGSFTYGFSGSGTTSFTSIVNNCSGLTLTHTPSQSCTVVGTYTDSTTPPNTATLTGTLTPNNAPAASATSTLTEAAAPIVGTNYLMWTLPGTVINYPVYVYQGGAQVNYIPSPATQAFAGAYPAGVEGKTFTLYYANNGGFLSCNVVFTSSGNLDPSTTCPSSVINPPTNSATANSNVYTLALGATAFTGTATPNPLPVTPAYGERGIVFENNTGYYAIQIQGTCADLPVCSGGYSEVILNGSSTSVPVGNASLTSSAFYVAAYCKGSSTTCPSQGPSGGGNWVYTGGYNGDNAGYVYATKVEFTFLNPATGASNLDVSAVDGFNIAVQLYPVSTGSAGPNVTDTNGAYCTYTVPPENSNALGAGLFQPYPNGTPIARIFAASSSTTNLLTMCTNSSVNPSLALAVTNSNGDFTGCMSPCAYATKNLPNTDFEAQYCCSGNYNTPETCTAPPPSSYVLNVDSDFQTIYSFAYGDAGADFACEGSNSYVVSFIPSNGITPAA